MSTGHAKHFLERLERALPAEADLALDLYRDAAAVRALLARSKLPEQASRVALSLTEADEGPYAVVGRDGGFVTCLAEGMELRGLPLVRHGKLKATLELIRSQRQAREHLEDGGAFESLMRKVRLSGPGITREHFRQLAGVASLMPALFVAEAMDDCLALWDHAPRLRKLARRAPARLRRHERKTLAHAFAGYWGIAHLLTAALALRGPHMHPEDWEGLRGCISLPLSMLFHSGDCALITRALWAAARIGGPLMSEYKRKFRESQRMLRIQEAAFLLAAIGARHGKLLAEVRKGLTYSGGAAPEDLSPHDQLRHTLGHALHEILEMPWEEYEPGAHSMLQRFFFRGWCDASDSEGLSPFQSPDEVPVDLGLAAMVSLPLPLDAPKAGGILHLSAILRAVARSDAEQLYVPEQYFDGIFTSEAYEPEQAQRLLCSRGHLIESARTGTVRSEKVGRNAPCPCGSGKKYKRCCGG